MKKIAVLIFLFLLPLCSFAGGQHEPVKIVDFSLTHEQKAPYILLISPVAGSWEGEQCTSVSIEGDFDAERWEKYQHPMSLSNHLESINLLIAAHKNNEAIYFGAFGQEVEKVKDCEYLSKGLFGGQYHNGMTYIYSIYGRI